MAAIIASGVDYVFRGQYPTTNAGVVRRQWELLFPNAGAGANVDYPTGGVPLTIAQLGYTTFLSSLRVIGRTPNAGANIDPYFEWNGSNTTPTLVGFEDGGAGAGHQQDTNNVYAIATPIRLVVETEGY